MTTTQRAIQYQEKLTELHYHVAPPEIYAAGRAHDGKIGKNTLNAFNNWLFERCFVDNDVPDFKFIPDNFGEKLLADKEMVRILDIARYQDGYEGRYADLLQAYASGIGGFIIKCGGAESRSGLYEDSEFDHYWKAAADIKAPRGTYFFHSYKQDPIKQADKMFAITGPLQPGDMWPVLDVEDRKYPIRGKAAQEHVVACLQRMHQLYKVMPMIYTSKGVWAEHYADTPDNPIQAYPCWVAAYNTQNPAKRVPTCYNGKWTIWQMGFDDSMPGFKGDVDRNVFIGGDAIFNKMRVPGWETQEIETTSTEVETLPEQTPGS